MPTTFLSVPLWRFLWDGCDFILPDDSEYKGPSTATSPNNSRLQRAGRSCAETAIAIGCLAIDEKFVNALIEDRDKHRLTSANVRLKDPASRQLLTKEDTGKLESVVAEVKRRLG